jgi:AcrR family transcriptional regulator
VGVFPPALPVDAVPGGTKGRILASALVVFAERGFYGTSIRTIAEGAGINSATLYVHFQSKERILGALVEIGSKALLTRVEKKLASASTSVERLDAIVRATVVGHTTFPLLAVVTNNDFYALSAELAAPARAPAAVAAALLRSILAEGAADGTFTLADPGVTAHVIEGMAQQIPMWVNPATDRLENLGDSYVAIARRIVGAD